MGDSDYTGLDWKKALEVAMVKLTEKSIERDLEQFTKSMEEYEATKEGKPDGQ